MQENVPGACTWLSGARDCDNSMAGCSGAVTSSRIQIDLLSVIVFLPVRLPRTPRRHSQHDAAAQLCCHAGVAE